MKRLFSLFLFFTSFSSLYLDVTLENFLEEHSIYTQNNFVHNLFKMSKRKFTLDTMPDLDKACSLLKARRAYFSPKNFYKTLVIDSAKACMFELLVHKALMFFEYERGGIFANSMKFATNVITASNFLLDQLYKFYKRDLEKFYEPAWDLLYKNTDSHFVLLEDFNRNSIEWFRWSTYVLNICMQLLESEGSKWRFAYNLLLLHNYLFMVFYQGAKVLTSMSLERALDQYSDILHFIKKELETDLTK